MTTARSEILERIRRAVADRPGDGPDVQTARHYRGPLGPGDLDLFAERVADYKATVHQVPAPSAARQVAACLSQRGARRVVVPAGFPPEWLPDSPGSEPLEIVADDPPLPTGELDRIDGVITTCVIAIAETGTIILDHGPGQGRRALTLVPDYHLVLVRAEQVLGGVPDAIAAVDATRPMTWISGPSATSDIELLRVEGVHGPRTLEVLLLC
jgi:L-lactate dehydrogenase complex protein LldG